MQHPKRLKVESVQDMSKALCLHKASTSVTEVTSRGKSHLRNVACTSIFATSEMGRNKKGPKYQKKLVDNFKHSACATEVLKTCQITAGVAQYRPIQEEPTRWNTTLHMLKRLYEQKRSILLAMTNYINSNHVTAAEVIPLINVIETELQKPVPADSGLEGLKNDFYSSMKIRFKDYENSDIPTSATLLDPHFTKAPFKDKTKAYAAKQRLLKEASILQSPKHLVRSQS
ncbi:hypothetical protein PR048_012378 [Dryococelus australis]|uniref:Uncharacterized protein n=1 Tax=Dryococelus australis TaxID=614101 RepID=A0ABQ9HP65_9NEOP|nr:hypothetical protein PR048_012378 [Dryococelus australis]